MEADKLTLRNWVLYDGKPTKIEQLGRNDDVFVPERYFDASEHIKPIVLTEEILKNNGLDMTDPSCFFTEDIDYKLELTVFSRTEIWWTIADCEYKIKRIKYVHELQNILKFLEIEKNIVL